MALIVPMPFTMKRKLFTFLADSPIIAKLQYGMKVRSLATEKFIYSIAVSCPHLKSDRSLLSSS